MKELVKVTKQLSKRVDSLNFEHPVTHVYNPLDYAISPHLDYIKKYANKGVVLLLGMNPGPFGMAQTGVPFGEVSIVKDFLKISQKVKKPLVEHEKRPIDGFDCKRKEVSGSRLWGWAKDQFGTADDFFKHFYVANYCPLVFMGETGKNMTPDKLSADERDKLFEICDSALASTVDALICTQIVGIGAFAEKVCKRALKDKDVEIFKILHPSPASPIANRGWAPQATKQLKDFGLLS